LTDLTLEYLTETHRDGAN